MSTFTPATLEAIASARRRLLDQLREAYLARSPRAREVEDGLRRLERAEREALGRGQMTLGRMGDT